MCHKSASCNGLTAAASLHVLAPVALPEQKKSYQGKLCLKTQSRTASSLAESYFFAFALAARPVWFSLGALGSLFSRM